MGGGVDGEFNGPVRLVAQQAEGVDGSGEIFAVDGDQVVADADVDADLRERRTVASLLIVASENLREAVTVGGWIGLKVSAEQGDLGALGPVEVAAGDVGVADDQLGDHFAEHVVQVQAVDDAADKGLYKAKWRGRNKVVVEK